MNEVNPSAYAYSAKRQFWTGMSGLDVAYALREIRPDLPVAMASGYITNELREQAPLAGVRELIYKPNTVNDLCAAVAWLAQTVGNAPTSC